MYQIQIKKDRQWRTSELWKPKTRGDAMNGVDLLHRQQFCARALENGEPFYSREHERHG